MNNKPLPTKALRIIIGAILIVLGLLLLINPEFSLMTVCNFLGIVSVIKGLSKIIEYKRSHNKSGMISGILFLVLSFLLFLHPKSLLSVFPVVVGIAVLIYGISTFLSRKSKELPSKILSIIMVIVGIVAIVLPFKFAEAITAVSGLVISLIGIVIIVLACIKEKPKTLDPEIESREETQKGKISSPTEEEYTEVEFTDVDDE